MQWALGANLSTAITYFSPPLRSSLRQKGPLSPATYAALESTQQSAVAWDAAIVSDRFLVVAAYRWRVRGPAAARRGKCHVWRRVGGRPQDVAGIVPTPRNAKTIQSSMLSPVSGSFVTDSFLGVGTKRELSLAASHRLPVIHRSRHLLAACQMRPSGMPISRIGIYRPTL